MKDLNDVRTMAIGRFDAVAYYADRKHQLRSLCGSIQLLLGGLATREVEC